MPIKRTPDVLHDRVTSYPSEDWWQRAPDVPEALRVRPPEPDQRLLLYRLPTRKESAQWDAGDAHKCERLTWLISSGHLSEGEITRAEQRLQAIRRMNAPRLSTTLRKDAP